jgi:hypothetical protein
MHRNHPQGIRTASGNIVFSAHNTIFPNGRFVVVAHATSRKIHPIKSFIAPLNPRCPTVGAPLLRATIPGQTSRLNNGTLDQSEDRSRATRAQRRTRT